MTTPALTFSLTDNSVWSVPANNLSSRTLTPLNGPIGSLSSEWNGHSYWIDSDLNQLVSDTGIVGPLSWYGSVVWDAQPIHGFDIGPDGIGWLADTGADDAMPSFLVAVDLSSAQVNPVGTLYPGPEIVNGLSVVPEPKVETLWMLFVILLLLGYVWRNGRDKQ